MSMKEEQKNRAEVFQEQQLVVFKVADEEFGVDINEVKEIIRWEEVTRIPNAAPYIKGVINLRGNIIVVNDLAMKLGLPSKDVDDDTRILVVEVGDNTVGMIVDSATEVLRLPGEKIRSAPSLVTGNIDTNLISLKFLSLRIANIFYRSSNRLSFSVLQNPRMKRVLHLMRRRQRQIMMSPIFPKKSREMKKRKGTNSQKIMSEQKIKLKKTLLTKRSRIKPISTIYEGNEVRFRILLHFLPITFKKSS
jgi:purine-binding chemotaxis protein CheW